MGNISLATTASLGGGGGGGSPPAGLFGLLNNIQIHQEPCAVDTEVHALQPAPFGSNVPPFSLYPAISTPTNINYCEDTSANRLSTANNILYPVYNLGGIGDPNLIFPNIHAGNYSLTLAGYYNILLDLNVSGLAINSKGSNMLMVTIGWEVDVGSFSSGLINILDIPFGVFSSGSGASFPELSQLSSQNAMPNRFFTVQTYPMNVNPSLTSYNNLIMAGLHSPRFANYHIDVGATSTLNQSFAFGLGYTQPQAPNTNSWSYDGTGVHSQAGQTGFISITSLRVVDNWAGTFYDILANQFNGNNIYIPIEMG